MVHQNSTPMLNSIRFVLDFLISVSSSTGIMLDPVYTGKAARGLVKELQNSPEKFKGDRILFLHTGKDRMCFSP